MPMHENEIFPLTKSLISWKVTNFETPHTIPKSLLDLKSEFKLKPILCDKAIPVKPPDGNVVGPCPVLPSGQAL